MCVSILVLVCPVFVCGIKSEYLLKPCQLCQTCNKFNALLHKTQQGASSSTKVATLTGLDL